MTFIKILKKILATNSQRTAQPQQIEPDEPEFTNTFKSNKVHRSIVENFKCKRWPDIKEWEQPNILRLDAILRRDDPDALFQELHTVEEQIGKRLAMDIFVELSADDDNAFTPRYPGAKRKTGTQYKTDWFSAAVFIGAPKCIQFALDNGWSTPNRGITTFHEADSEYDLKEYKKKNENASENSGMYAYGFIEPVSSLKRECLKNNREFDWVSAAKKSPVLWGEMPWCKTQIIGSNEWLKRLVFDIIAPNPTEDKFLSWCKEEAPRAYFEGGRKVQAVLSERIVNGLIELGWCKLENLEYINNWFQFSDINQKDNYRQPITEATFNHRKNRIPIPSEFTNILERIRLQSILPQNYTHSTTRLAL